MAYQLSGCTVVVTGASSGIGRGVVRLLDSLGAAVILVGRREEALRTVQAELSNPERHYLSPLDLTKIVDFESVVRSWTKQCGPLGGLVHSAGVQPLSPLRIMKPSSFSEIMELNVASAIRLTKAIRMKGIRSSDGLSVVFVSSVMGLVGQPGRTEYCASKAALVGVTKALALELAGEGIRVNCVAPGVVESPMTDVLRDLVGEDQMRAIAREHPLGLGTPEDVAHSIAFLLSQASRWITGTTLVVDGGYTAK